MALIPRRTAARASGPSHGVATIYASVEGRQPQYVVDGTLLALDLPWLRMLESGSRLHPSASGLAGDRPCLSLHLIDDRIDAHVSARAEMLFQLECLEQGLDIERFDLVWCLVREEPNQ